MPLIMSKSQGSRNQGKASFLKFCSKGYRITIGEPTNTRMPQSGWNSVTTIIWIGASGFYFLYNGSAQDTFMKPALRIHRSSQFCLLHVSNSTACRTPRQWEYLRTCCKNLDPCVLFSLLRVGQHLERILSPPMLNFL